MSNPITPSTPNPKFYNLHPKLLELERAIFLYPHDIDRRLIYADAIEEFAVQGKYPGLERADFIRTQIELERVGPSRKLVKDVFVRSMGSDYWAAHFSDSYVDYDPPKVGDRIDIKPHNRRSTSLPTLYGLLVTKVQKDPEGYEDIYGVKRDEKSVPHPGTSLREKLNGLFRLGDGRGDLPLPYHGPRVQDGLHSTPNDQPFTTEIWPSGSGGVMPYEYPRWRFVWRNGFPDYVQCSGEDWLQFGPYIVQHSPVCDYSHSAPITPVAFAFPFPIQWARREAGLEKICSECSTGITTSASRSACADCGGIGWVVNDS